MIKNYYETEGAVNGQTDFFSNIRDFYSTKDLIKEYSNDNSDDPGFIYSFSDFILNEDNEVEE